jgi:hypothetical protein
MGLPSRAGVHSGPPLGGKAIAGDYAAFSA